MSWFMAALAAIAPAADAEPKPAGLVPEVAVLVLSLPPERAIFGDRREEMADTMRRLLAALHAAGRIRYRASALRPEDFERCLAMGRDWRDTARGKGRDACIARLLPARVGDVPQIAILVEQMIWRSAAEGITCIGGGGGAIVRGSVHLGEIDHPLGAAREGVRGSVMDCIEEALGRE